MIARLRGSRGGCREATLEVQAGTGWALQIDRVGRYPRELRPDPTGWAPMRLEGQVDVGVDVEVTGRTFQPLDFGQARTRARVTFLGDGEPDETVGCWLYFPQRALQWA